ncbi:MAG: DUF1585 domain-containing protein [Bacteriovoracia bacterium]
MAGTKPQGNWLLSSFALLSVAAPSALADVQTQAQMLFQRLAGHPIALSDPKLAEMMNYIRQGQRAVAASFATNTPGFYNNTVLTFATRMLDPSEDLSTQFTDARAMVVGVARDDLDARILLTGNFNYRARPDINAVLNLTGGNMIPEWAPDANDHYVMIEQNQVSLYDHLVRVDEQRPGDADFSDTAGLLTSREWGASYISAGTNRRGVDFAFQKFFCTQLNQIRNPSVPDFRIRRDVSRAPAGEPATFVNTCKGCHGQVDALAGAFAYFEFSQGKLVRVPGDVQSKMNKNGGIFEDGYFTTDDSFMNYFSSQADFGWRGSQEGNGVHDLGQIVANAKGFSQCMAKRAFREVCQRPSEASDESKIRQLADSFEAHGYSLRRLFEETAVLPNCLFTE